MPKHTINYGREILTEYRAKQSDIHPVWGLVALAAIIISAINF